MRLRRRITIRFSANRMSCLSPHICRPWRLSPKLVPPKEKDASADAKAWAEKLDFLLDQAYQNRKDMMAVWRETDAVCAAFEKRLEEEREKDE